MSNKRPVLPTELEIDELLKIVENSDIKQDITKKTEDEEVQNKIYQFLIQYDIKPGYQKVPKKLLTALYSYWSGERMSQAKFTSNVNMFLPSENKYGKLGQYFRINKSIAAITKHYEGMKPKKLDFTKSKIYQKLITDFIQNYNLKPGKFYVEVDIMYYLFCTFLDKKRRKHISQSKFESLLYLFFKRKFLGYAVSWYGFTEDIIQHLPKELVDNWRQGRLKYGKKEWRDQTARITQDRLRKYDKIIYKSEEEIQKEQKESRRISSIKRIAKLKIQNRSN